MQDYRKEQVLDNDADILTDVRGHDALLLNGFEKIPVKLELDDEGWPALKTGAINVRDAEGDIIDSFHLHEEALRLMSKLLDVSKGAAQGAVIANIVRQGHITDEQADMYLLRSKDGAVISHEGGNKFSLKADSSLCLANECIQLAETGCIEDSDKPIKQERPL